MSILTILTTLLALITTILASAIPSPDIFDPVGSVKDAENNVYPLKATSPPEIKVITPRFNNGIYMRPVSYEVGASHVCKFYRYVYHDFWGLRGLGAGKRVWRRMC
jgi:hypothetical protein